MSSSLQLRRRLKADPRTLRVFGDVLPVDRLPKNRLRRKPRLYIINTDESTKPGEHWILTYFHNNGKGVYFDPYGFDVHDTRIKHFLDKNCIHYIHNSRHLQGALSHTCGHFCVYVARRLARGFSLKRALRDFSTFNSYYNDRLVVSNKI